MNHENVIQAIHKIITLDKTLCGTSMKTIRRIAREYGEEKKCLDDVNHWLAELDNMNFESHESIAEKDEWFKQWLSKLP